MYIFLKKLLCTGLGNKNSDRHVWTNRITVTLFDLSLWKWFNMIFLTYLHAKLQSNPIRFKMYVRCFLRFLTIKASHKYCWKTPLPPTFSNVVTDYWIGPDIIFAISFYALTFSNFDSLETSFPTQWFFHYQYFIFTRR